MTDKYGPWAIVTGASEGIGREFALHIAKRGVNLVLVARRGEALAALAQSLPVATKVVVADLATPEGMAEVIRASQDLEVGLLVASAGFGTSGAFIDGDIQRELAMVDLNCRAVAELAHHFGGRFARQGRGGIVFMSSLVAFQGVPRAANYAATKAYVQSLAEGLRVELAPFGVDVIACAPGPIRSGFERAADMRMSMAGTPAAVAAQTLSALGRRGTVRPGWLSKLLEWSLACLPRSGRVRMMGLVMGGMTRHQAASSQPAALSARSRPS